MLDQHRTHMLQAMPRAWALRGGSTRSPIATPDAWRPVSGVGQYVEHSRTNAFPHDIAREFLGFRALRPDGLSIVVDNVTTPDARTRSSPGPQVARRRGRLRVLDVQVV